MVVGVRSSKYRHVYGDPTRKDKCFDNIRLTKNAFDANLAKSNGKYVSLNWDASGGGSFAVLPVSEQGKLPDRFPLFDGHKGPVLDTDWNPFDDEMVVSASEDGTIGVWHVPPKFSVHVEFGSLDDCPDVSPEKFLEGHGKKVGHVKFNPVARDVLASASLDNTVKIWNVSSGEVLFTLSHPAFVTSFDWNYDGTQLITVAKDKQLRVWNVREEKIISSGKGHAGAKGSRVVWLGDRNRALTTGFSLVSDREMALWDTTAIEKGPLGGFRGLDPSSGIVIPHYDPMTSMVYLGGRGDGKIVYYEFADDQLYDLFAYNSTSPQRGLGWIPNRRVEPGSHEVARVYKVHETLVEPITFKVPLRNEGFLDSVYAFVESGEPALTAREWQQGKTARPLVKHWKDIVDGKHEASFPAPPLSEQSPAVANNKSEVKEPKKEDSKDPKKEALTKEVRKDEPKKDEPKKVEPKKDEPKKDEPKKDEPKKDEPKKDEPKKDEPKKELNKDIPKQESKEGPIAALDKAEKQDAYDVLQSKEVQTFLAKNSEKERENVTKEEDDSAWDDEPSSARAKVSFIKPDPEPKVAANVTVSNSQDIKAEDPKAKAPESKVQPKAEPKAVETKREPTGAGSAERKSEPTTTNVPPIIKIAEKLNLILQKLDDLSTRVADIEAKLK